MTLLQKLETGMAARRAELINQPLARIWGELAIVALDIIEAEVIAGEYCIGKRV